MAIEQSTIMETDFQSMCEMRNAPTPPLIKNDPNEEFNFDLDNIDFTSYQNNFEFNDHSNGMLSNQITYQQYGTTSSNVPIMFQDPFANAPSSSMTAASQYPATLTTNDHSLMNETITTRESVSKMSRKEKCMSRNAIAARENREKKKKELNSLSDKANKYQEEAATYKKKYIELKELYKVSQEQNQYYESVLSNLPSIMGIIDHMKQMPNDNSKRLKKKLGNNFPKNDLGICFHVKSTSQDMSLKFCEFCSNGTPSVAKKKNVET